MKKSTLMILGTVTVLAFAFIFFQWRSSLTPLWSYKNDQHLEKGPLMGIIDINLLEDYFRFDHFGKTITYQIEPKLQLRQFKNPLHEYHALEALNKSLKETLGIPTEEREHLVHLLHKNLIEDFNRSLIKQAFDNQIEQGQIDWRVQFIPEQKLNIDYHDELKKDGTLIWAPNSQLAQELYAPEKTLREKIKNLSIPYTNQTFQYMAGEIQYFMQLSSQKDNDYLDPQVTGEINYTKYYRINTNKPFETSFKSPGFQVDYARFRSKDDAPILKVTATSYFNSLQLIPIVRSLKIEFDHADEFLLSGKLETKEREFSFETFISKLHFHVQNNSLDRVNRDLTVIRTDLLPRGAVFEDEGLYKHQVSSKILREHARELMQMFNNREFSSSLKSAASQ